MPMRIYLTILFLLPLMALAEEKIYFSGEITPKSLSHLEQKVLKAAASFKDGEERVIVIEMNSGGGNLFATLSFIEQIQKASVDLNFALHTRVRRACESSCTVLFTAGSVRQASRGAEFGFHSPAIASKVPRGMDRKSILRNARERWLGAVARVDIPLSYELDRRGYLLHDEMSYMSGKELNSGYVSELIR